MRVRIAPISSLEIPNRLIKKSLEGVYFGSQSPPAKRYRWPASLALIRRRRVLRAPDFCGVLEPTLTWMPDTIKSLQEPVNLLVSIARLDDPRLSEEVHHPKEDQVPRSFPNSASTVRLDAPLHQ